MWRPYTGVIHCVFDQNPNLQNCIINPKENPRRGGGLGHINTKHLPPSPFTSQFLRKPTFRVWCLYRYLVHGIDSFSPWKN